MALTISVNPSSTGYVSTGSSVGFPGEYSNRSFMFAAKVTIGSSTMGPGDEVYLWTTENKTHSDIAGFPAVTLNSRHSIILQRVSGGYRLKIILSVIDNFPVLASYARTGVYLHQMTMYSNTFSLTPTASNHIMFRYKAFERDTTADGTNQNLSGLGTAVTSSTSTGFNTSSTGFEYTQAYVNGTDVWSTLNWTQSTSSNNLTSRNISPWKYYSVDTQPSTYNRIGPYNQGSGSYVTGFNTSQLGGYSSQSTTLTLDEVWVGDWDGYTGSSAPDITNFYSGGSYVTPSSNGTLNNGLRARIYYSSSYSDGLTNLGSLGSAASITNRNGSTSIALSASAGLTSQSTLSCNAGLKVNGSSAISAQVTTVFGANKILNIVVGRYFSDDYVDPGYVTDDTFNIQSEFDVTPTFYLGAIPALTTTASLDATATMLYGTDYGIELVAYTLLESESEETLAGEVLDAGTFTLTADAIKTAGASATLSTAFAFDIYVSQTLLADVALVTQFSLDTEGGFLGTIIDMADQVSTYTWDDPPTWENMNNGVWSVNGLLDQSQFNLNIIGGFLTVGSTAIETSSTLTATGTNVVFGEANLATAFALLSGSKIVKDAEVVNLTMASTLTATGLRTQEIASTLFGSCSITTQAQIKYGAVVNEMPVTANASIVGGVRWLTPEAALSTALTVVTAGGVKYLTPTATLSTQVVLTARGSLSKIDPYRRYQVDAESRTIRVYAESRTIMVPENTRVFRIAVPPILQPTIERQV